MTPRAVRAELELPAHGYGVLSSAAVPPCQRSPCHVRVITKSLGPLAHADA